MEIKMDYFQWLENFEETLNPLTRKRNRNYTVISGGKVSSFKITPNTVNPQKNRRLLKKHGQIDDRANITIVKS
jgi:hypothetical protein